MRRKLSKTNPSRCYIAFPTHEAVTAQASGHRARAAPPRWWRPLSASRSDAREGGSRDAQHAIRKVQAVAHEHLVLQQALDREVLAHEPGRKHFVEKAHTAFAALRLPEGVV